jgi:hypothetical protein
MSKIAVDLPKAERRANPDTAAHTPVLPRRYPATALRASSLATLAKRRLPLNHTQGESSPHGASP